MPRFQRYQLPAWAHTQSRPALAASTSATNSPTSTPEREDHSTVATAVKLVSDSVKGAENEDGAVDVHNNAEGVGGGNADGDSAGGVREEQAGTIGVKAGEGRDSPPPMLEALVSGIGSGGGSFSCNQRYSSSNDNRNCSSRSAVGKIGKAVNISIKSSDTGFSGGSGWTGPSPPSLPPRPPTSVEEKEEATREQQRAQEQQQGANRNSEEPPGAVSPAATTASRQRKVQTHGGGGGPSAKPRARWGVRRKGTEMASTSAAAPGTVAPVARGGKGDELVPARGRMVRPGVQDEVGRVCAWLG